MRTIEPITDLGTHPAMYVSAAQLALYLGIPKRTIYNHIQKGSLPAYSIAGIIRILTTDARAYASVPATPSNMAPLAHQSQ